MSGEALICGVGVLRVALPLKHVDEAMRPLAVQALPAAPSFVLGVSVIRDQPVPVLDTAALLGTRHRGVPRRLVLLRLGERRVALTMDEILGLRDLDRLQQHQLPPLLRDAVGELVSAIGALDGGLLLALQAAFQLPESLWAEVDGVTGVAG